jgi:hypothetical protein
MGAEMPSGEIQKPLEAMTEHEHIKPDETSIEIARHGGPWTQEKGHPNAGLINTEALPENIETIKKKVEAMRIDPDTFVAIFCSSTAFDGEGQRAVQTAGLYREAILEDFKKHGTDDDHLLSFSEQEGGEVRQSERIGEWNGWNVDATWFALVGGRDEYGTPDPMVTGYETHRERLDAINKGDLRQLSERVGVETPEEMGENLQKFLRDVGAYATFWHAENPGKKLQVVIVTHGERIRKFKDIFIGGEDFDPKPNEGMTLNIDKEGITTLEFQGQTLPIDIDNLPDSLEK